VSVRRFVSFVCFGLTVRLISSTESFVDSMDCRADAQEEMACAESCVGAGEEAEGASVSITLSICRAVSSLGSFSLCDTCKCALYALYRAVVSHKVNLVTCIGFGPHHRSPSIRILEPCSLFSQYIIPFERTKIVTIRCLHVVDWTSDILLV
jgi:hypothetical protein